MTLEEDINVTKKITRLLTGNEVAQILNISRTYAYQLMRFGKIRTIRMGRLVRVRVEDLEDFIVTNVE
jgi:excisionase family DNA binding protein